jgi:S-DNA-T family DNA segregation ATPase FtsK/SpoIIIE
MTKKTKEKASSIPDYIWGLLLLTLSLVLMLSLASFSERHPSRNWIGLAGHALAWGAHYLFGISSFLFAVYIGWMGALLLFKKEGRHTLRKTALFTIFLFSLCSLLAPFEKGGEPFASLYYNALKPLLGALGSILLNSVLLLTSFYYLTKINIFSWIKKKEIALEPAGNLPSSILEEELLPPPYTPNKPAPTRKKVESQTSQPQALPLPPRKTFQSYTLPPPSILTIAKKSDTSQVKSDLKIAAKTLEDTLESFGIEAKVQNIQIGPTIASFEVQPSSGVKVQKIKALENDIALNMQAKSIRIIAPIPGKAAVGIEIPNPYPQEVGFRELIENYHVSQKRGAIPLLLGKGVSGEDIWADLTKMPHLIIAGATGSGKSVCINTIVMSILMNAHPSEIKLLMVDPKKVELTAYTPLPHMLAPVITEATEAHAAFLWLVKEMEKRYEIFRRLSIRNIASFNERKINVEAEAALGIEIPKELPYIVAIVDELADLMMVSTNDIETPIARIAQMARAVGIHLILATQRPSREVLTGLIKANFPTRLAFKVASRINSQIILDDNGAEALLGNGDMLFMPPGTSSLIRGQGAFIRDADITKVIEFICQQMGPQYLIPSFKDFKVVMADRENDTESGEDALYEQARTLIFETGNASTTFLQRKLKIGYARAASLMDELEANHVIGPADGAKPRKIFYPGREEE